MAILVAFSSWDEKAGLLNGMHLRSQRTDALEVHSRRPAVKKNISTTTVTNTAASVDVNAAQPQVGQDGGAAPVTARYQAVVELDVGDRQSHYCATLRLRLGQPP
jgi:hypothetical protein